MTRRAAVGLWLAPLTFAIVWMLPLPLPILEHRLLAVFLSVLVAWVTECVPVAVTALLIAPLLVVTGVTDAKTAFASYANPLLFLFVGGFFIARAMTRHGLDVRIAEGILAKTLRGDRGPSLTHAAFGLAALVMSMWISNTATAAILIPIAMGVSREEKRQSSSVLAIAYACSVGGMGTLVGSPPNAIAAEFINTHLQSTQSGSFAFGEWLLVGLPTSAVLSVVVFVVMRILHPGCFEASVETSETQAERVVGPWSRGERVTALSFGVAVLLWTAPAIAKAAGMSFAPVLSKALPGGGAALLAASLLFIVRDEKGECVLPWHDAAKIDWGIIMLFGGGIALGSQLFQTGLAERLGGLVISVTGVSSLWSLTALAVVFTIFFTEVCSNTASSNMLVPLIIAAALNIGVSPIPPALGVALAASCAFMLPIATGPNAIAFGTGRVSTLGMLRTGFVVNLVCAVALLGCLYLLCSLFDLA